MSKQSDCNAIAKGCCMCCGYFYGNTITRKVNTRMEIGYVYNHNQRRGSCYLHQ